MRERSGPGRRRRDKQGRQKHDIGASSSATTAHAHPASAFTAPARPTWFRHLHLAAVVLLAILLYANSLPNDFVYDDVLMIKLNPRLASPWDWGQFFGTSYWAEAIPGDRHYRPLTVWSFSLDRALFGPGPLGVHVLNVLSYALVCALAYLLTLRLFRRSDLALMASLLFAAHPVHTEVVANGVGRSELYTSIWMLLGALLHLRYVDSTNPGRSLDGVPPPASAILRYVALAGAVVCYGIALLFKESAVVLPGLLFLMEWIVREECRLGAMVKRLPRYLAYAIPLTAYLALRFHVIGAEVPNIQTVMGGTTDLQRRLYGSETLLRYLGQLLVPAHLCAEYSSYLNLPRPRVTDPLVLLSLLAWVAAAVGAWTLIGRRQYLPVFALAWFLFAILPASNLVLTIGTIRADRLLFLPSFGFTLVLGWGIAHLARRNSRTAHVILGAILVFYGVRTLTRNRDWSSDEALWTVTVRQNPGSAIAHTNMGNLYRAKNEYLKAAEHYKRAFELRDSSGALFLEAHRDYATMMQSAGRNDEAEREWRSLLSRDPSNYYALANLGQLLLLRQPPATAEARELLERACDHKLAEHVAFATLAQSFIAGKEWLRALDTIEKGIRLDPANTSLKTSKAGVLAGLAESLRADGKTTEAIQHHREALETDPDQYVALVNLGQILMRSKSKEGEEEAVKLLQRARQVRPKDAVAAANLAQAYYYARRNQEALAMMEEALRMDNATPQIREAKTWLLRHVGPDTQTTASR